MIFVQLLQYEITIIKLQQAGNISKQNNINDIGHIIQILDNSIGNKIIQTIKKQLTVKKRGQNIHGNSKLNIHILHNIQEKKHIILNNFLHPRSSHFF